ncbi:Anthocyanin regulatory R-S protein [Dichanthelium oligosanthes]|uniref:Anthocyanin regulatory R-S protein n=1 Tax=Dichanthelium oligosanthes TaxID=888268 RepID=A0A1E5W2E8_9POAL|nr:Anthocyanin regulatory R-S protein [Dichanthelium oligosanthes]
MNTTVAFSRGCRRWGTRSNLTEQADNAIVLLDDLDDENAMETMIDEGRHELAGEVDCLFNTNLEQITKEIDDFYALREELDVQPLAESSWMMDSPYLVAAPEAKDAATQSVPGDSSHVTSFRAWTMPRSDDWLAVPVIGEPQKLLKKVVSGGAWMNNGCESAGRMAQESGSKNHVVSERRRQEKLNEMFLILKSLVPTIHGQSIHPWLLAETVAYLRELEQKVQELESSRGHVARLAGETMLGCHDNEITGKRVSAAKRKKPSELNGNMEREQEHHWVLSKDGASHVINVSVTGTEVLVQVQCRWKELLMARVFDAIKNLHLVVLSVQASTPNGLLGLKIQAQFASSSTVAPGMIREALQKAISNS